MTVSTSANSLEITFSGLSATISPVVHALSIDMLQEQPTQNLSLAVSNGNVNIARQPVTPIEMIIFGETGMAIDFMSNEYVVKL
jgi:hypothetical protein